MWLNFYPNFPFYVLILYPSHHAKPIQLPLFGPEPLERLRELQGICATNWCRMAYVAFSHLCLCVRFDYRYCNFMGTSCVPNHARTLSNLCYCCLQYNSKDTSPLSNYLMHPFWNLCVKVTLSPSVKGLQLKFETFSVGSTMASTECTHVCRLLDDRSQWSASVDIWSAFLRLLHDVSRISAHSCLGMASVRRISLSGAHPRRYRWKASKANKIFRSTGRTNGPRHGQLDHILHSILYLFNLRPGRLFSRSTAYAFYFLVHLCHILHVPLGEVYHRSAVSTLELRCHTSGSLCSLSDHLLQRLRLLETDDPYLQCHERTILWTHLIW